MVVGTGAAATLRHAFNGTITVEPVTIAGGSANNGFSIEFDGVPSEACSKFATMDLGTGMFSMDVSGGSASNGNTRPMSPTAAAAACGSTNSSPLPARTSVVLGQVVSVRVNFGGRRLYNTKHY